MSLLTHPDAGGDQKNFKTINLAYQILTNDAAREANNIYGLDEIEKLWTKKLKSKFFICKNEIFLW